MIGERVQRLEDGPLVRGQGCFVADIDFPHQLHMRVVRSSHAHGRLLGVDTGAALAMPGVHAVWTHEDVAALPPIPFRETSVTGLEPYRQPVLAGHKVRYVGEPVAVVFAEDAYLAEDAAELVELHIDELPVLLDACNAPGEFDPGHDTEPVIIEKGYGDLRKGFAGARHTLELRFSVGRHSAVPLETRGAVARHDASIDRLELHGATKRPHWNRDRLAEMLGRSPSSMHLIEVHVGGSFGVRGEIYPEDVLVCLAALRLGRPVKWIEDRREHLMAANHSREQVHEVRVGFNDDGEVLALDDTFFHDQGAYVRTHGARVADLSASMLPGPYRLPAYRARGHYRLTNKTPAATYRSPGRFETSFVRERVMDAVAAHLGLDAVAVRRRNLIPAAEMPFARHMDALETSVELDSGDYAGLLDRFEAQFDWRGLRDEAARRRGAGECVGTGLAMFIEKSGLGPVDGVELQVDETGRVVLLTGAASFGQGVETVLAQICAQTLGVDYREVQVVHGRTDRIAFGFGTHASRTTVMTGEATRLAASKVRARALEVAAELLQRPVDALGIDGGVIRAGGSGASIALAAIAQHLAPASSLAAGREPGLRAEGWFRCTHMAYPYGVHGVLLRVDRDTGGVHLERYCMGYDVGRAVNPTLIEGQLAGGLAQGVGGALFEEFCYDAQGNPLSVTLADYAMVSAREMPAIDMLVTEDAPSPLNPLGLKGAGEGGVPPVGAAIAAAIDDALGQPGAVDALPMTAPRVHALANRIGPGS